MLKYLLEKYQEFADKAEHMKVSYLTLGGDPTVFNSKTGKADIKSEVTKTGYPVNGKWKEKILFCLGNDKLSPRQVAERLKEYETGADIEALIVTAAQYLPTMFKNHLLNREEQGNKFLYFIKKGE